MRVSPPLLAFREGLAEAAARGGDGDSGGGGAAGAAADEEDWAAVFTPAESAHPSGPSGGAQAGDEAMPPQVRATFCRVGLRAEAGARLDP